MVTPCYNCSPTALHGNLVYNIIPIVVSLWLVIQCVCMFKHTGTQEILLVISQNISQLNDIMEGAEKKTFLYSLFPETPDFNFMSEWWLLATHTDSRC